MNLFIFKNSFFDQFCKIWVFMAAQHFWKFYIPILLFDEQRFKQKIGLLSPFWKFEFFNKLATLYPPNWIESLYRRSWNFIHMLKVRWYNFWVTYKAIERFLFFWTGLMNMETLLLIMNMGTLLILSQCYMWVYTHIKIP